MSPEGPTTLCKLQARDCFEMKSQQLNRLDVPTQDQFPVLLLAFYWSLHDDTGHSIATGNVGLGNNVNLNYF
jgi:hypothetical protein